MTLPIYQVDAFSSSLFGGNPAAVCPLNQWISTDLMQKIAAENNLSETAFLVPEGDQYGIRWFTPAVEVALCGHATLASAFVLFNYYHQDRDHLVFQSKSGPLEVSKEGVEITLDFPADPPQASTAPEGLQEALGVNTESIFKGKTDYLVLLENQSTLMQLTPDFKQLASVKARGVIVTAPGDEYDFVSRFFGPASGVDEDPVTGSAHCTLTPFWQQRLHKNTMKAFQCSKRGGEVKCTLNNQRVLLTGQARLYLKGTIDVD